MKDKKLALRWSSLSMIRLTEIIEYIQKDFSSTVALKVYKKIRISALQILEMLYVNPICDELSFKNKERYRYILCYKYKFVYRIFDNYILILDIFHSSRTPRNVGKK